MTYCRVIEPRKDMHDALLLQATQCETLGSHLYATVLRAMANDLLARGLVASVLDGASERPIHDAVPLRLLGAVHRLVLEGRAPELARHYPSVGGTPGASLVRDVLQVLSDHRGEVAAALSTQVQTNEVARSLVPLVLGRWLRSLGIEEYVHLEVGASAGLNLNFHRYSADDGLTAMGDPRSAVHFGPEWFHHPPPLPTSSARATECRGADPYPVDISTDDGRTRLLSFVWPDQVDRFERLTHALEIAAHHPPAVTKASADAWLASELSVTHHAPTMVFHSIVWQYLGKDVQQRMRDVLEDEGRTRSSDAPLMWARMEPAGSVADVRATLWNGGEPVQHTLAEIGYHGRGLRWLADSGR